jgi:hypothetical protein
MIQKASGLVIVSLPNTSLTLMREREVYTSAALRSILVCQVMYPLAKFKIIFYEILKAPKKIHLVTGLKIESCYLVCLQPTPEANSVKILHS